LAMPHPQSDCGDSLDPEDLQRPAWQTASDAHCNLEAAYRG